MKVFKAAKGKGITYIIATTLIYNIIILLMLKYSNSYELSTLLELGIVVIDLYFLYYTFLYVPAKYIIDDNALIIKSIGGLKKIKITISDIETFNKASGNIKGVKLSGYAKNSFAFGKSLIDKLGTIKMFVTSNKNIVYIKTKDENYGISPENFDEFVAILKEHELEISSWQNIVNRDFVLYKEKRFIIPLFIVSIVILILTFNPFIMYLRNSLPAKMPLKFNGNFTPVKFGTGKQFAFKQMAYGLMNMAILFCMYYASYFYAKYDKKMAFKFIYVALAVAVAFLFMQIRILRISF
jgi:hypothetical protein